MCLLSLVVYQGTVVYFRFASCAKQFVSRTSFLSRLWHDNMFAHIYMLYRARTRGFRHIVPHGRQPVDYSSSVWLVGPRNNRLTSGLTPKHDKPKLRRLSSLHQFRGYWNINVVVWIHTLRIYLHTTKLPGFESSGRLRLARRPTGFKTQ